MNDVSFNLWIQKNQITYLLITRNRKHVDVDKQEWIEKLSKTNNLKAFKAATYKTPLHNTQRYRNVAGIIASRVALLCFPYIVAILCATCFSIVPKKMNVKNKLWHEKLVATKLFIQKKREKNVGWKTLGM